MDVQTMQALLSLLTLMVLVFGGLLGVLWGQLTTIGKALSLHQLHVAENYVTSDEHERRITAEIKSLKEQLERFEKNMTNMLEMKLKGVA